MPIQEAIDSLKAAMQNGLASEAQLQDLKSLIVQGHQARIQAEIDRYQSQIEQLNSALSELPAEPQMPPAPEPVAPNEPAEATATVAPEEPVAAVEAVEPVAQSEPAPPVEPAPTAEPAMRATSGGSVNQRYAGLRVGLNDRVAFVKQLFDGRDDDFQRVIAALATLDSREECERFLNEAVYPDFNWEEKEEFAERFHALIYARFD